MSSNTREVFLGPQGEEERYWHPVVDPKTGKVVTRHLTRKEILERNHNSTDMVAHVAGEIHVVATDDNASAAARKAAQRWEANRD